MLENSKEEEKRKKKKKKKNGSDYLARNNGVFPTRHTHTQGERHVGVILILYNFIIIPSCTFQAVERKPYGNHVSVDPRLSLS